MQILAGLLLVGIGWRDGTWRVTGIDSPGGLLYLFRKPPGLKNLRGRQARAKSRYQAPNPDIMNWNSDLRQRVC